ncbi:MAG TPA: hypothetical protein VKQ07_02750 [Jatrophihabitantaceae bacterium]|nr:hypothetical protein [Jatrophihabitantaceae bacterium]
MELLVSGPYGLVARHVRVRDRIAAALHADAIDVRLARGAAPESDIVSALRSRWLTGRRHREALACGIERAIDSSGNARSNPFAYWSRTQVLDAMPEMYALRERLDTDGVPPAQVMASARLLLTDGSGPLYNGNATRTLRDSLRAVLDAFDTA